MRNRKEPRSGRLWLGSLLLLAVGGVSVLALWALPGDLTETAQAAGTAQEQPGGDHSAGASDEHEGAGHSDHEPGHEDVDENHGDEEHTEDERDVGEEQGRDEGGHEGDEHAGHAGEEEGLRLTPQQRERFGIVVRTAGSGSLRNEVRLPGEIVFNEDRLVHLVPRVAGIVREVTKTVGDKVAAGEVLAVIDSRALAEAKAAFLAARERLRLAQATFEREEGLWREKISAEREYLEARQALAEARIALNAAEQKLRALGFSDNYLKELLEHVDANFTRYEIRAPFSGTIIEKHITLGEALQDDAGALTIADTSSVWVNLAVYTKNLAAVRTGQDVVLQVDHSGAQARGNVTMLTPFVEESTRSATARVVLDNADGRWRPGTFVTGFISTSEDGLAVVIPRNAVQSIEGRDIVFAEHEGNFEMAPVTLGRTDHTNVEVLAGLEPGTRYVAEGAFQLKATVITSNLGSHAGHGH